MHPLLLQIWSTSISEESFTPRWISNIALCVVVCFPRYTITPYPFDRFVPCHIQQSPSGFANAKRDSFVWGLLRVCILVQSFKQFSVRHDDVVRFCHRYDGVSSRFGDLLTAWHTKLVAKRPALAGVLIATVATLWCVILIAHGHPLRTAVNLYSL